MTLLNDWILIITSKILPVNWATCAVRATVDPPGLLTHPHFAPLYTFGSPMKFCFKIQTFGTVMVKWVQLGLAKHRVPQSWYVPTFGIWSKSNWLKSQSFDQLIKPLAVQPMEKVMDSTIIKSDAIKIKGKTDKLMILILFSFRCLLKFKTKLRN